MLQAALVTSGRALSGTCYKQHWLQVDVHYVEQVTSSIGYKWTCIKWNVLQAALVTSGRALSGTSYKQHWLQVDVH